MCGITGYIGKKEALPIVFENLKKLEYRGYDSAGVAFFDFSGDQKLVKAVGKLGNLEKLIKYEKSLPTMAAIGHTRWATHGVPNEVNAHPHFDCKKEFFLVHNGIIENYRELKDGLMKKGHNFRSQTDTEVLAHLVEEYGFDLAIKKVIGAYAIAAIFKNEPQKIYIARLGSPLVIGVGKDGYYVASDPTALAVLVKKVIFLKDGQRGLLALNSIKIGPARPKIVPLEIDAEQAKKGKFPHFMLKEIFEGSEVVAAALRGRIFPQKNLIKLGGLEGVAGKIPKIKRMEIISCGTSYYAGMIGAALFKELANLPTETILASEYRYARDPKQNNTACLFISQSGETADTLAALKKAKERKYLNLGLVNAVGSSIARETDAGVYNHAGPEIGVGSTKAFLSQLSVLSLMSLYFGQTKFGKNSLAARSLMAELVKIPAKIQLVLKQSETIKSLAKKYAHHKNFLYLGRGYNYPAALEGALKLKEISYAHAEGYAGGEMKHGPIALIDKNFPVVALVNKNHLYEKMISNLEEIKARNGKILAIASIGDKAIAKLADDVIYVPETVEQLEPILNTVPLQLFAYYFAVAHGNDVDKPRNSAKSVTVE